MGTETHLFGASEWYFDECCSRVNISLRQMPRKEEVKLAPISSSSRIYEIHHHDILLGRGGRNNQHSGNEILRQVARQHALRYNDAQKKEKTVITREIVQQMFQLSPPARFLRKENDFWVEVNENIAREKVSQVLRDAISAIENNQKQISYTSHATTPFSTSLYDYERRQHINHATPFEPYTDHRTPYYNPLHISERMHSPHFGHHYQQQQPHPSSYYTTSLQSACTTVHSYSVYPYPNQSSIQYRHSNLFQNYSEPSADHNERKRPSYENQTEDIQSNRHSEWHRYSTNPRPCQITSRYPESRPIQSNFVNYVTPGWTETNSTSSSSHPEADVRHFSRLGGLTTHNSPTFHSIPTPQLSAHTSPLRPSPTGGGISLSATDMELILGDLVRSPTPVLPENDHFDSDSQSSGAT